MQFQSRNNHLLRYGIAGIVNTILGYGLYASLTFLLRGYSEYGYILASVLSNVIAITIAYINYKFFVFKTKGNYLREYLRFYLIYGLSFVICIILLPILVEWAGLSPYVAGLVLIPVSVVFGYLGHRNFSFKPR